MVAVVAATPKIPALPTLPLTLLMPLATAEPDDFQAFMRLPRSSTKFFAPCVSPSYQRPGILETSTFDQFGFPIFSSTLYERFWEASCSLLHIRLSGS